MVCRRFIVEFLSYVCLRYASKQDMSNRYAGRDTSQTSVIDTKSNFTITTTSLLTCVARVMTSASVLGLGSILARAPGDPGLHNKILSLNVTLT